MIDKKYYRITELPKKFGLLKEDVQYLFEQEKLPLTFFRPHDDFILGTINNSRFTAHCFITYSGLVQLYDESHYEYLLKGGSTSTRRTIPIEVLSIEDIEPCYFPNLIGVDHEISSFEPKELEEFQDEELVMVENSHATRIDKGDKIPPNGKVVTFSVTNAKVHLTIPAVTYELSDLVIEHKTLVSLGIIKQVERGAESNFKIEDLISHLVKTYPTKNAKALWQLLLDNWEQDDDLDPFSMLTDMTNERLYYINKKGTEASIGQKRFANLVSYEKR